LSFRKAESPLRWSASANTALYGVDFELFQHQSAARGGSGSQRRQQKPRS
jgi:hypothetical protein